jgi:hypothetical protein
MAGNRRGDTVPILMQLYAVQLAAQKTWLPQRHLTQHGGVAKGQNGFSAFVCKTATDSPADESIWV